VSGAQSQLRLLRTALRTDRARGEPVWNFGLCRGFCWTMRDFPIDPELRICVSAPGVLRRTNEAIAFIRKMIRSRSERAWLDVQQSFEDAWDDWSAMEAVVRLELLLEAEGLLIEDKPAPAPPSSLQKAHAA